MSRPLKSVRRSGFGGDQVQDIAELFSVLSEPTRLRILHLLHDGPANVTEIARRLGIKQANASKQLGILRQAGIVARRKNGLEAHYSIRMPLVFDLCTLVCNRLREDVRVKAEVFS
jgi:DNA-binding transcriptional ArsR family regulator